MIPVRPIGAQEANRLLSFSVLGSGSSGNSTVVSDGRTCVLVDAGLSCRTMRQRMADVYWQGLEDVSAIVLTHEHGDHAGEVNQILKTNPDIVVYMSNRTREETLRTEGTKTTRALAAIERVETFNVRQAFQVGTMEFDPFPVSHRAIDPCGFTVAAEGLRLTIATDLGVITSPVVKAINRSMAVVLESNYDVGLLAGCLRPEFIRERTASDLGHLSNDQVNQFLRGEFNGNPLHLILAHVSYNPDDASDPKKTNGFTMPAIMAKQALRSRGMDWIAVRTARQDTAMKEIRF